MDEVAGRVASEDRPAVRLGQEVAAVDEDAAGGGEVAGCERRGRPVLAQGEDLDPRAQLALGLDGGVLHERGGGQVRVPLDRLAGHHDMAEVVPVVADEPPAPVVEGQAELAHPRDRLEAVGVPRVEAEVHAADVDHGRVALAVPLDLPPRRPLAT